jgi:hypothetical protein
MNQLKINFKLNFVDELACPRCQPMLALDPDMSIMLCTRCCGVLARMNISIVDWYTNYFNNGDSPSYKPL